MGGFPSWGSEWFRFWQLHHDVRKSSKAFTTHIQAKNTCWNRLNIPPMKSIEKETENTFFTVLPKRMKLLKYCRTSSRCEAGRKRRFKTEQQRLTWMTNIDLSHHNTRKCQDVHGAMETENLNIWWHPSFLQYQKDNAGCVKASFQSSLPNFKRAQLWTALRQPEFTAQIGPCHHPRVHIWTSSSSARMTAGADVSSWRGRQAKTQARNKKKKNNLTQTKASSLTVPYSCTYAVKSKEVKWKQQTKTLLNICHQKQENNENYGPEEDLTDLEVR